MPHSAYHMRPRHNQPEYLIDGVWTDANGRPVGAPALQENPMMCKPSMTLCGPTEGFPLECCGYDPATQGCAHGASPSSSACIRRQVEADLIREALPLDDSTADNEA